jgi:hypothetical protein
VGLLRMTDTLVTAQTIQLFSTGLVINDGVYKLTVTVETVIERHLSVEVRDLERFWKITGGKGDAVVPTIDALNNVFAWLSVGCVTIVTHRHRLVAAVLPRLIDIAHDVTIDTGIGII